MMHWKHTDVIMCAQRMAHYNVELVVIGVSRNDYRLLIRRGSAMRACHERTRDI